MFVDGGPLEGHMHSAVVPASGNKQLGAWTELILVYG